MTFAALSIVSCAVNAQQPDWAVVNEFGDSKTYIDRTSVVSTGTLVRATLRYALSPPGTDKRNGKPVKEMLMSEEYDVTGRRFRILSIQFLYTDGSASEPLTTDLAWRPATAGNATTLEYLRAFNAKR